MFLIFFIFSVFSCFPFFHFGLFFIYSFFSPFYFGNKLRLFFLILRNIRKLVRQVHFFSMSIFFLKEEFVEHPGVLFVRSLLFSLSFHLSFQFPFFH